MTQGWIYRIFAGIAYPPVMGWFLFGIIGTFNSSGHGDNGDFKVFLFLLFFAYLYMTIPSILFSLLMEFIANRFISSDIVAIIMAGVIGLACGHFLGELWWQIGMVTGLLIGWHLRSNFKMSANKLLQPNANASVE